METLMEYRCHNCKYLLYKADNDIDTEAVCPSCHRVNYPARNQGTIGLRGIHFQEKAVDIRDPLTNALLLRAIGLGIVEIKPRKSAYIWKFAITTKELHKFQAPRISVNCINTTPEVEAVMRTNRKKFAR